MEISNQKLDYNISFKINIHTIVLCALHIIHNFNLTVLLILYKKYKEDMFLFFQLNSKLISHNNLAKLFELAENLYFYYEQTGELDMENFKLHYKFNSSYSEKISKLYQFANEKNFFDFLGNLYDKHNNCFIYKIPEEIINKY